MVVDDFEPFRRFVRLLLQLRAQLQIVGEASDGLQAVQKAKELQPELILLDVGLPKLNGIEVANTVRKISPSTKIIFVTQESAPEVAEEALRSGAMGYVLKARARTELLPAIEAVLNGKRFVSSGVEDFEVIDTGSAQAPVGHDILVCSGDEVLLHSFTRFVAPALRGGNPAIVIATKPHQESLAQRLKTDFVDVDAHVQRGTYVALDAVHAFSTIMVDGLPDPVRFFETIGGLMEAATKAANATNPRIAFCGEALGILWTEGKVEAAIRLEQLCNALAREREIDMLCAYPLSGFHGEDHKLAYTSLCAEHSAVHFR